MYRIELLSDPSGVYSEPDVKLPETMSAGEIAFCFDSEKLDCIALVEAGNGEATVEDELTGALIRISVPVDLDAAYSAIFEKYGIGR